MQRVLAIFPEYHTSSRVNVVISLEYLQKQGQVELTTLLENEVQTSDLIEADVLIVGRTVDPTFKAIYEMAQQIHLPIIYDLDDYLLDVPKTSSVYKYFNHPDKQAQLKWILRAANLVRVHSPRLQQLIQPYNFRTHVIWAAIDWDLAPSQLPALRTNPIEIVYAASPTSGEMFFNLMLLDLKRLLTEYGSRIRLNCLGYVPPELKSYPNVVFKPFETNYEQFFREFTRYGYGIGLAPMLSGDFYQSKTNLKFRDYAAAGAVGIYSNFPLYSDTVTHLETGLLVSGEPGSWYDAVVTLLENPDQLDAIRYQARHFAEQRYNLSQVAQMWLDDLKMMPQKISLSPEDEDLIRHIKWWFNQPRPSVSKTNRRLLSLYQQYVPFSVHIVLSKLYHKFRRHVALFRSASGK